MSSLRDQLLLLQNKIGRLWHHKAFEVIIWCLPIFAIVSFCFRLPAPGVAAIICAGFVGLIVLRDLTHTHKMLCVIFALALIFIEIQSIRTDRANQLNEHIATEKRLQEEFEKTKGHIDAVLTETTTVLAETETVLKNLTGGDSYPWIEPNSAVDWNHVSPEMTKLTVPLMIYCVGNSPLSGLTITASKFENGKWIDETLDGPQTIPPHGFVLLKYAAQPLVDRTKQAQFMFSIFTRNGEFQEIMRFRLSKDGVSLAHLETSSTKAPFIFPKDHQIVKDEWSDGSR